MNDSDPLPVDRVDPARVPQRRLPDGTSMPAIGLGAFAKDKTLADRLLVTSIWFMEELVERIVRWGIHPDTLITHRFPLSKAPEAFELMAGGKCGKVAICFDEELQS